MAHTGVEGEVGKQTKIMPCIKPKVDCGEYRTHLDTSCLPALKIVYLYTDAILITLYFLNGLGIIYKHNQVVAGEYDLDYFDGWERVKRVSHIVLHPSYDFFSHDSDVALIRMHGLVFFNERIHPLPLPDLDMTRGCHRSLPHFSHSHRKDMYLIAGWGMTAEVSEMSHLVLQAYVPIISREECWKAYPDLFTDTMICAGNITHGGLDPCQGDWGGALVTHDGFIKGVSSWSIGCGRPGFPGVYIDVTKVMDWICEISGAPFR
ncbi:trypsin-1-like [Panulirus ornatus]|uniref:trypsin-1-like n=1 Tax=Panulirus ornatus TaxID=150431 RepID=UPI003A889A4F